MSTRFSTAKEGAAHTIQALAAMRRLFRVLLATTVCSSLAGAVVAATFVVTSVADNADALLNGTCADAGGQCTLRAAMQEAVFAGGTNSITFNVPAASLVGGVAEIVLTNGPLPVLTGATLQISVDGATQPGTLNATVGVATRVGTGADGIVGTGDEFLLPAVAQPKVLLIAPAGNAGWPGSAQLGMIRINAVSSVTLNGLQFAATRGAGATFTPTGGSGPIAIEIQNAATVPTVVTLTVTRSVFGFEGAAATDPGRAARLLSVTNVLDNTPRLNGATVNFRGNYLGHLNNGGIMLGGFDGPAGQILPVVNIEENFIDYGSYGFPALSNPIQIWGAMNSSVSRNLISHTRQEGAIHLQRFSNSRVDENSILDTQPGTNPSSCGYGIAAQGGTNSFVRQNRIEDSGSSGIALTYYNVSSDGHPVSYRLSKNAIARSGAFAGCVLPTSSHYDPGTLGIDLYSTQNSFAADLVTPNSGALNPLGGNSLMNYPVLTSTVYNAGSLTVKGYVGSASGQAAFGGSTVEFFVAADDGNNNGGVIVGDGLNVAHGEGYNLIGSCVAAADGTFNCTLAVPPALQSAVASGKVTSTATLCTGGCGNANTPGITSEFGAVLRVTDQTPVAPVPTIGASLLALLMLLLPTAAMLSRRPLRSGRK